MSYSPFFALREKSKAGMKFCGGGGGVGGAAAKKSEKFVVWSDRARS